MPCRTARLPVPTLAIAALTVVGVAVGCGQTGPVTPSAAKKAGKAESHGHDHHHADDHGGDDHGHEHPTTLTAAVDQVGARLASLETAFKNGDHVKADAIVHEIGHLLEDGEKLLAKAPESVAAKAREAWKDLGDCLADVDGKLHDAGDDKDAVKRAYEGVKARIGSAVDALRGHLKSQADPAGK